MSGTSPRLLVVVLNWRTADMSLRATRAAATALAGLDAEVVVVDNDSGDGSEAHLRAGVAKGLWPVPVRVVQSGRNGGFGAGMNAGIRTGRADGMAPDYIYILNSDAFPEAGAIRALVDHLEAHPEAGFAGSAIVGEDGAVHQTAFRFPSALSEFEGAVRFGPVTRMLSRRRVPMPVPRETGPVDWLSGASLMMRTAVLDRIGLFDEGYFLYFEETDLCRRCAEAGHAVHYVAESRVMHLGSVSTGMSTWSQVPDYWFDSRWRYFEARGGRRAAAGATLAHLAGAALGRVKDAVKGVAPPRGLPGGVRMARHALRRMRTPGHAAPSVKEPGT